MIWDCVYVLFTQYMGQWKQSKTPLIRINSEGEPSEYAENPDNWIFL